MWQEIKGINETELIFFVVTKQEPCPGYSIGYGPIHAVQNGENFYENDYLIHVEDIDNPDHTIMGEMISIMKGHIDRTHEAGDAEEKKYAEKLLVLMHEKAKRDLKRLTTPNSVNFIKDE